MTPLETLLLVSFAMLTRLQSTLTWLNSRRRRGLIAQRWPVAIWEPIIGGHAQCVKDYLHISSTVSVRWWNTISWNPHAVSMVGTSCIYLFLPNIFCLPVQITLCTLSSLHLHWWTCHLVMSNLKSRAGPQTEPEDYRNDAGLLCIKHLPIKDYIPRSFLKNNKNLLYYWRVTFP